jgi:hypothetical protein
MCHKAGNKSNTICIDQSAVAAHLAHGCTLGQCGSGNKGIEETEELVKFSVYPNPNSGNFKVTIPVVGENAFVTIMDMSGRVVLRQSINGTEIQNMNIDLNLASGIYMLEVGGSENSFRTRVQVK